MAISRGNSLLMKKQWAEDGSTVIPNPPVAGTTYRDESVDEDNIAEGQQYDGVADSARWNQLLYIITGILKDALAHGVLPWLNTQDYSEGAVVIGSNGELYRAKAANGPATSNVKDPVSDSAEQTWARYATLKSDVVVEPLSYSIADGLKLALGNGLQTLESKLVLKILQNKGLSLSSDGLQVLVSDSWAKFDSTGKISGSYGVFSGNVDELHKGDDLACEIYYVTSSATGTHPGGLQGEYMLMVIGNIQLALGGTGLFLTRKFIGGPNTWSAWDNVAEKASTMPVGAVYVQFANQPDPTSLFGGTWSNISGSYAGRFFRAEGGAATAFGGGQQDGAPEISGSLHWTGASGGAGGSFSGAFHAGTNTPGYQHGADGEQTNAIGWFNASRSSSKYGAATEVRPVNSTIRIWKRTA